MIDAVDHALLEWAENAVPGVPVALTPPGGTATGVSIYLLELGPNPPARTTSAQASQFGARYLVTVSQEIPEAHRILGDLVFAAMSFKECTLDLTPPPIAMWAGFGVPPQPSFIVLMPVRRPSVERRAPLVTRELVLRASPMAPLAGRVLGPEDTPLAGAWVEVPALDLLVQTGRDGTFRFDALPTGGQPLRLRVRCKGQTYAMNIDRSKPAAEPFTIRIQPSED